MKYKECNINSYKTLALVVGFLLQIISYGYAVAGDNTDFNRDIQANRDSTLGVDFSASALSLTPMQSDGSNNSTIDSDQSPPATEPTPVVEPPPPPPPPPPAPPPLPPPPPPPPSTGSGLGGLFGGGSSGGGGLFGGFGRGR